VEIRGYEAVREPELRGVGKMSFLFGGREVSCYRDGGVKLGEIVEV